MLSNTSKYAIRAAIYLALYAGEDRRIDIKEIADQLDIPSPFLSKILQNLAKNRLLISYKGPNGGFSLAKKPEKIKLFDIIEITEGSDYFEYCVISMRKCHEEDSPCPLHNKYQSIKAQLVKLFQEQSLADFVMEIQKGEGKVVI